MVNWQYGTYSTRKHQTTVRCSPIGCFEQESTVRVASRLEEVINDTSRNFYFYYYESLLLKTDYQGVTREHAKDESGNAKRNRMPSTLPVFSAG